MASFFYCSVFFARAAKVSINAIVVKMPTGQSRVIIPATTPIITDQK